MEIAPLGDAGVLITLGETVDPAMTARVRAVAEEIRRHPPGGFLDVVPAFASVAVWVDPLHAADPEALHAELAAAAVRAEARVTSVATRTVIVPVCYGGEFGPDLDLVAQRCGRTAAEVVALHQQPEYLVHAIGFSPGFPYLGGLPAELATPRRPTPRLRVPAGSVGIGGVQTGVYPLSTPGGWNLIGRTPLALFDVRRAEQALLRAGDRVRFKSIDPAAFQALAAPAPPESGARSPAAKPEPAARLEIVRAGMFTTVQDLGRPGVRHDGVPVSGAADPAALRLANALVGNPDDAAALEFTQVGPELRFSHATLICVAGGEGDVVPNWRPLAVAAGEVVRLGPLRQGCRGYVAVAGGIALAPVLGSRSTYVRGGFGGWEGRALRDGDVLPLTGAHRTLKNHWHVDERILPRYSAAPTVRILPGPQAREFDAAGLNAEFRVSPQSDRMGVRLQGPPLVRRVARELLSAPVTPGTVQVPPDGQPIVLLADAQTIGGYPQIAHVISADLPLVAQLRPGDALRLRPVDLAEAKAALLGREKAFGLLREGIAQKLA